MADETTGTTTGTGTATGTPEGQNAGGTGTGTGTGQQQGGQQETARFTQADVDRMITERLARDRKSTEERTAKEKQAAETERMKAQAEWEELAKTHEQAVRELEPQLKTATERYSTLAERLNKQIDAGIKDWPAEARKMVPASEDVAARLDAFENMRALVERGAVAPRQPGNSPGPRPTAGPDGQKQTEEQLRATGRYAAI